MSIHTSHHQLIIQLFETEDRLAPQNPVQSKSLAPQKMEELRPLNRCVLNCRMHQQHCTNILGVHIVEVN